MAAGVKARLPNWQAGRAGCQNGRPANIVPNYQIIFSDFSLLTFKNCRVEYRYKKEKEKTMYNDFVSNLIVCFLLGCWVYLFIYIPLVFWC